MKHHLKIWPSYYHAVKDGSKVFEVRKNDRGFQKGDLVRLYYYDPDFPLSSPPRDCPDLNFTIGYVLPIDAERVVFSLLPDTSAPKDEG